MIKLSKKDMKNVRGGDPSCHLWLCNDHSGGPLIYYVYSVNNPEFHGDPTCDYIYHCEQQTTTCTHTSTCP
jgi:hypothetical protein